MGAKQSRLEHDWVQETPSETDFQFIEALDATYFDATPTEVRRMHTGSKFKHLYFRDDATRHIIGYCRFNISELGNFYIDWFVAPKRGKECLTKVINAAREYHVPLVTLYVSVDEHEDAKATRARLLLYARNGFTATTSILAEDRLKIYMERPV